MTDDRPAPSREDVDARWVALIEGRTTREEVHAWASQWVGKVPVHDPMVDSALLHLHGFGLWVGANPSYVSARRSDDYLHSDEEVVNAYRRWQADCVKFDTDREGYLREKRAAVEAHLEQERRKNG